MLCGGEIEDKKVGTNSGCIVWYNYYLYGVDKRKGATEDRAWDLNGFEDRVGLGRKLHTTAMIQ